jgi:hypothetical protein
MKILNSDGQPKHVTIGLFETTKTIGQALAKSLIQLLDKYGLTKKNITYVKDEGFDLNAMIAMLNLKFVVNCEYLGIEKSFHGTCFGHAFSKACQYGIAEEKICRNLKYVSIKFAQTNLHKCIIWP